MDTVELRSCKRCGSSFARWEQYKHPGSAATHCQACYLTGCRERSYRLLKAKGPRPQGPPRKLQRPQSNAWKALRLSVIAEETQCGICGKVVDKLLSGNNTWGPCVDHIEPIEFGGDYWARSNLRLAHHGCNSREGQQQLKRRYVEALAEIQRLRAQILKLE